MSDHTKLVFWLAVDGGDPLIRSVRIRQSDGSERELTKPLGKGYPTLRAFCIALLVAKQRLSHLNPQEGEHDVAITTVADCYVSTLINALEKKQEKERPAWLRTLNDFLGVENEFIQGTKGRPPGPTHFTLRYRLHDWPVERVEFRKIGGQNLSNPVVGTALMSFAKHLETRGPWKNHVVGVESDGAESGIEQLSVPVPPDESSDLRLSFNHLIDSHTAPFAGRKEEQRKILALIDVRVWNPTEKGRQNRRLEDVATLPLRAGDSLRVEIKLPESAFAYVLWISGNQVQTLYPWIPGTWTRHGEHKVDSVELPRDPSSSWSIEDPAGVEALVVMAGASPLPSDYPLGSCFQSFPDITLPQEDAYMLVACRPRSDARKEFHALNLTVPVQLAQPEARIESFFLGTTLSRYVSLFNVLLIPSALLDSNDVDDQQERV